MKDKTTEQLLRYDFEEAEIKEMSKTLAYSNKQLEEIEDAKKTLNAEFSSKIQSAKAQISKLAGNINNGYDYRQIECTVRYDQPSAGQKTVTRTDTGEIVKVIEMTEMEKQGNLFEGDE